MPHLQAGASALVCSIRRRVQRSRIGWHGKGPLIQAGVMSLSGCDEFLDRVASIPT